MRYRMGTGTLLMAVGAGIAAGLVWMTAIPEDSVPSLLRHGTWVAAAGAWTPRGLNRLQRTGTVPAVWIPPREFRHLEAQAGTVPVTKRSGKQRSVHFRFACDKSLRHVVDQVAFLSLLSSAWARAYYDQQRARGHAHHQALRAVGAKWLKIIFVMWHRQVPYDEQYHLATMARQQLRQRQQQIA